MKYKIGKINLKTLKKFNFFEFLVKNSYNLTINDTILTKFGQWKLIPTYDEEIKKKLADFSKILKNFVQNSLFLAKIALKMGFFHLLPGQKPSLSPHFSHSGSTHTHELA